MEQLRSHTQLFDTSESWSRGQIQRLEGVHLLRTLRRMHPSHTLSEVAWNGRLAQLVRAPALQAGCRGFESLTAHHLFNDLRWPDSGNQAR